MAKRDIQRIFMRNGSNASLFLNEWKVMPKESKQEFRIIEKVDFHLLSHFIIFSLFLIF